MTLNKVQTAITNQPTVVVFISSRTCSICHADEPRVRALAADFKLSYYQLDIMDEPALASVFEVLTVPAVLIFHQGKEWSRQARFIEFNQLTADFEALAAASTPVNYEDLFKKN